MFPATAACRPAAASIRPTSVVVVDLPFVPVMATTGPAIMRDASSTSPTIGTRARRARARAGCRSGTPGLSTIEVGGARTARGRAAPAAADPRVGEAGRVRQLRLQVGQRHLGLHGARASARRRCRCERRRRPRCAGPNLAVHHAIPVAGPEDPRYTETPRPGARPPAPSRSRATLSRARGRPAGRWRAAMAAASSLDSAAHRGSRHAGGDGGASQRARRLAADGHQLREPRRRRGPAARFVKGDALGSPSSSISPSTAARRVNRRSAATTPAPPAGPADSSCRRRRPP